MEDNTAAELGNDEAAVATTANPDTVPPPIEVKSLQERIYAWLASVQPAVFTRNLLKVVLALTAVSCLSIFTYGSFYYAYIPRSVWSRPLYFQRSEVMKQRMGSQGSMLTTTTQMLQAEIPMIDESAGFLGTSQTYSIDLELDMPESEVNYEAGTFMISSLFYDKSNELLTSSSRLVMIRYRSWLLRTMDTLVYAPFYLIGWYEQTQTRNIQLFKHYQENAYKPTSMIAIQIDNPNVQLYGATLVIQAKFRGLRYYMYYWPITTSLLSVGVIWGILFVLFGSTWFAIQTREEGNANEEVASIGLSSSENQLALNAQDQSLEPAERASHDADNHTEVTNLGVTPLDSSDMMTRELLVRRRNHQTEHSST